MTIPRANIVDDLPDLVIEQADVRLCHARALLIDHRNMEGAGFKFCPEYTLSDHVVPVTDSVGRRIGTAYLERESGGLYASIMFDSATPERLDAEIRQARALARGKLILPEQTLPLSLDTDTPFPLLRVVRVNIESVMVTSRTGIGQPLVVVDEEERS